MRPILLFLGFALLVSCAAGTADPNDCSPTCDPEETATGTEPVPQPPPNEQPQPQEEECQRDVDCDDDMFCSEQHDCVVPPEACETHVDGTPCPGGVCWQASCEPGCFIDEAYYTDGQIPSDNSCVRCDSASPLQWTPRMPLPLGCACPYDAACDSGACECTSPDCATRMCQEESCLCGYVDTSSGACVQSDPEDPCGGEAAIPLPNHESLFATDVIAMYIFRPSYITSETVGTDTFITQVRDANAQEEGEHTIFFDWASGRAPLWVADCGENEAGESYGCARFDGVDDFGEATDFYLGEGQGDTRVSLVGVMRFNDIEDGASVSVALTDNVDLQNGNAHFMTLLEQTRHQGDMVWRYNGYFVPGGHNVDVVGPDGEVHLHEHHLNAAGNFAVLDGVVHPYGGGEWDAGLLQSVNKFRMGGQHADQRLAAVDIYEVVLLREQDQARESDSAVARYRTMRIQREYPCLPTMSRGVCF